MNPRSLLSVDAALQEILQRVEPLPPVRLPLDEALGLVLAEDIQAQEDLPPFANSAMDGFAVRAGDVASASREHPARLKVVADKPAGSTASCEVVPGTAVRIMTGAELPPGSEAVVPVESTTSTARDVEVFRPVASGENLRFAGEDVRAGTLVLVRSTLLRSAEIGLLAAIGRMQIAVRPAPRVAVMTTGAELVEAGERPGPGQVRDANLHALSAQVREAGCPVSGFPRVPDRREAVAIRRGAGPRGPRRAAHQRRRLRRGLRLPQGGPGEPGGRPGLQPGGPEARPAVHVLDARWQAPSSDCPGIPWRRWSASRCTSARPCGR